MRNLLLLALLGFVAAGCAAPAKAPGPAAKEAPPRNSDIANRAPEGGMTDAVPTKIGPPLPVTTANPTAIVLTPIQANTPVPAGTNPVSTTNWKTFTSAALGVTVSYPSDWSVAEQTNGATFTSPKGATIALTQSTASPNNGEVRIANQYCTSRTNPHGQTAEVCVDNASFTYTASFTIQKADGTSQRVTLMTKTRTVGDVFQGMFDSLQPAS